MTTFAPIVSLSHVVANESVQTFVEQAQQVTVRIRERNREMLDHNGQLIRDAQKSALLAAILKPLPRQIHSTVNAGKVKLNGSFGRTPPAPVSNALINEITAARLAATAA